MYNCVYITYIMYTFKWKTLNQNVTFFFFFFKKNNIYKKIQKVF